MSKPHWHALTRAPNYCSYTFYIQPSPAIICTVEMPACQRVPAHQYFGFGANYSCKAAKSRQTVFKNSNGGDHMAHGGRRQGAGRPVGTGSPLAALKTLRGKERAESIGYLRALAGTADDPARIALDIAKDPAVDVRLRIDCAVSLIPFVHPKLSYIETSNTHFSVHADAETVMVELESRLDRLSHKPPEIRGEIQETDCISVGKEAESLGIPDGCDSASTSVSALCPREAA